MKDLKNQNESIELDKDEVLLECSMLMKNYALFNREFFKECMGKGEYVIPKDIMLFLKYLADSLHNIPEYQLKEEDNFKWLRSELNILTKLFNENKHIIEGLRNEHKYMSVNLLIEIQISNNKLNRILN